MGNKGKSRLLVADIHHHTKDLMSRELEIEGYEVQSAGSEKEFNEIARGQTEFDVLIIDPELFPVFDLKYLADLMARFPGSQLIVHAYKDCSDELPRGESIVFIEKNASSIDPLKDEIRRCCAERQRLHLQQSRKLFHPL